MTNTSPSSQCECGCGSTTAGRRFRQGHDAKLKSVLVKAARSGDTEAQRRLEKLGWIKFLRPNYERKQPKTKERKKPTIAEYYPEPYRVVGAGAMSLLEDA